MHMEMTPARVDPFLTPGTGYGAKNKGKEGYEDIMLRKQIEKEKYQLEQDIQKATSYKAGGETPSTGATETPMTATPTTSEVVGEKRKR